MVVETEDLNDSKKIITTTKIEIDKDSEVFFEYQSELQEYIDRECNYNEDTQKHFTIVLGQCSPDIEELLKLEATYNESNTKYDSIGLMKLVEKLCYS